MMALSPTVLCVVLCMMCGCASMPHIQLYEGEHRSSEDIAVLYIGGRAGIRSVNEQTPSFVRLRRISNVWRYPDVLELLPGTYRIVVAFDDDSLLVSQPTATLTLQAQAGHSYTIGAVVYVHEDTIRAWRAALIDNGVGFTEGVSPYPVYRELGMQRQAE